MIRSLSRILYIIGLVTAIGHVLLLAVPFDVGTLQAGTTEARMSQVLLTAVAVREVYASGYALWRDGRRRWRRWRRGRRSKVKARPSRQELVALAGRMFPEPPLVGTPAWTEAVMLAVIKRSVRGVFNLLPESTCVAVYRSVRWVGGRRCVYCGGQNLRLKDPHYRTYFQRHTCKDCTAERGREVTFYDLTGTILAGSHLPVRLWLWGGLLFVSGTSTLELKEELGVNYKTARRMVSLFQLAYLTQRFRFLLSGPVEIDEVYIVGGQKGRAGGLPLLRPPRCRGLKAPGRGTWETDKIPVLGLVDRQGQVYLIPCANVKSQTIQPFVEHLVARGATVYTDSYNIYTFLHRLGYQHERVNHSRREYARGEVHVNSVEGLWSLLRDHLRIHRGVSKVYLPLYVARFEFIFNRRDQQRWGQLVDLLALGCRADGDRLRRLVREDRLQEVCLIPGLALE
jgi:transposase